MNCLAFLLSLTTSVYSVIEISSDRTGNVFVDNETVSFYLKNPQEATVSVKDYAGKIVLDKKIPSGESKMEMGILPRDFYTVTIKSGDEGKEAFFAVIPSENSRVPIEDSNVASDLATSWLVKPEQFEDLAKLTKMAGIIWVRDRLRWGEIEPERGIRQEWGRYDHSAEAQIKHGLKVYQVFHDTPRWAKEDKSSRSMPDDLRDIYNFAVEMANRFKGKVAAWEVWNEPDIIHFSDEMGDSYAAMLKAMYLGFKSADPELPVLICSFAMVP